MKILFVCKSNVFRSPVAAAILNSKLKQRAAESAGTQRYDKREIDKADCIFAFDGENERILKANFPQASKKIFLLKKFLGYKKNLEIPDLVGTSYKDQFARLSDRLIDKLGLGRR